MAEIIAPKILIDFDIVENRPFHGPPNHLRLKWQWPEKKIKVEVFISNYRKQAGISLKGKEVVIGTESIQKICDAMQKAYKMKKKKEEDNKAADSDFRSLEFIANELKVDMP